MKHGYADDADAAGYGTGELIVGLWAAWPSFSTETPKVLLYIYKIM
jgi:hypothetical protein